MVPAAASIQVAPEWHALADKLRGTVALVVGAPGAGKTCLAHYLAEELARREPVALINADMGQAAFGVATCLASMRWGADAAPHLWFVGDTTPVGNLLPAVVGAAQLVDRALRDGATTVLIDSSGLVEGAAGRVLKYHKVLAADVARCVVLERGDELAPLRDVLAGICLIERVSPHGAAHDRTPAERRQFRAASIARHFVGATTMELPLELVLDLDWSRGGPGKHIAPGTVAGLLDAEGFCLGLGLVERVTGAQVELFSAVLERDLVRAVQLGRRRFAPDGMELA